MAAIGWRKTVGLLFLLVAIVYFFTIGGPEARDCVGRGSDGNPGRVGRELRIAKTALSLGVRAACLLYKRGFQNLWVPRCPVLIGKAHYPRSTLFILWSEPGPFSPFIVNAEIYLNFRIYYRN